MSMDYGTAYIGIRTKDGKLKTYVYGYDNEIVPDIVLCSDWMTLFENASTREEAISRAFVDPWMPDQGLKETIEDFDFDGEEVKDYKRFIKAVKGIKTNEVDVIALGVVHGGKGFYKYDWRIIDFESGDVHRKTWERNDDSYNGPGEECIEETIKDWEKSK